MSEKEQMDQKTFSEILTKVKDANDFTAKQKLKELTELTDIDELRKGVLPEVNPDYIKMTEGIKKKKITSKKVIVRNGNIKLKSAEKMKVEMVNNNKTLKLLEVNNIEKELNNKKLSIQNFQLNINLINNEMFILNKHLSMKKSELTLAHNVVIDYMTSIKEKYKLGEKWKYDSNTGEIQEYNDEREEII